MATAKRLAKETVIEIGEVCACYNLRRAARLVTQLFDDAMRPSGVRVTQFTLLSAICGFEPVTVGRLAAATGMDRTTLTRNLQLLERQKLVRSQPGADQREREVSLTEHGHDVLARALPHWRRAQAALAKRLGPGPLEHLLVALKRTVHVSRKE